MAGKLAQLAQVSLGITTDVTPLKILGLNNFRWLQGVPTWDAFTGAGKDKPVQLEQVSTGGGVVQAGGEGR